MAIYAGFTASIRSPAIPIPTTAGRPLETTTTMLALTALTSWSIQHGISTRYSPDRLTRNCGQLPPILGYIAVAGAEPIGNLRMVPPQLCLSRREDRMAPATGQLGQ